MSSEPKPKHLMLAIELPSFYTEDIDIDRERREFFDDDASDSDIILGLCGEPVVVHLTMEVSGEKDSEVIDVLGLVCEASLREASGVTTEYLEEHAWKLRVDQDEAIESAVRRLRREDVPPTEILELLEGEVEEMQRRIAKQAAA